MDSQVQTQQPLPGGMNWAPVPLSQMPSYSPALACLATVDQFVVNQKKELVERAVGARIPAVVLGYESAKYEVKNGQGSTIFTALEDSNYASRSPCGNLLPVDIKIIDRNQTEVMKIKKLVSPLACQDCCFPCCLQTMDVECPPGTVVGRIEQQYSFYTPKFDVKNKAGKTVLKIKGTYYRPGPYHYSVVKFDILSADGKEKVGEISNRLHGYSMFVPYDPDLRINFELELDDKIKATLLGALFLIGFVYVEFNK